MLRLYRLFFLVRRGEDRRRMGRKRKRGPKRRPLKTGGVQKGTTHVSDEVKEAVVQLKRAGYSGNKIARALELPRSTVYRIISVHANTGATGRRKGSGRPRSTTAAEDDRMILSIKRDRSTTSTEISAWVKPTIVSDKTVRRRVAGLIRVLKNRKIWLRS